MGLDGVLRDLAPGEGLIEVRLEPQVASDELTRTGLSIREDHTPCHLPSNQAAEAAAAAELEDVRGCEQRSTAQEEAGDKRR